MEHALRPIFTASLAQTLQRGSSINLVGAEGQGRWRLLEDLSAQADTLVLLGDLKKHSASQKSLLQALWKQAFGADNAKVTLPSLLNKLEQESRPVWLLLHHYDAILDNPDIDPAYGPAFVDALNSLRNRGIRLLCVTQKPHNQSVVLVNGKPHSNSWLDLQRVKLPALSYQDIVAELQRQFAEIQRDTTQFKECDANFLAQYINRHKQPYAFLTHCTNSLRSGEYADIPVESRIGRWKKDFRRGNGNAGFFKHVFKFVRFFRTMAIVTGIHKISVLAAPFRALTKLLEKLAGDDKEEKEEKK